MNSIRAVIFVFLLLTFFHLLYSQDTIPVEVKNIVGKGKAVVYYKGKIFHYSVFEIYNKAEVKKVINTTIYLENVEERKLPYRTYTILSAEFQNLSLGSTIIFLSKITGMNVMFGKDLWREEGKETKESFEGKNLEKEEKKSEKKGKITALIIATIENKEELKTENNLTRGSKIAETDSYEVPKYLLANVTFIVNKPIPLYDILNAILKEYNLIVVKISNKLIKINKKKTLAVDVTPFDKKTVNALISKLKKYLSPAGKIVYDPDVKKVFFIDASENIEKIKPLAEELRLSFLNRLEKLKKLKAKQKEKERPKKQIEYTAKVFYLENRRDLEIAIQRLKNALGKRLIINIDRDFNALIIYGKPKYVKSAEKLLSDLVSSINTSFLTTKVFYVRYISPYDLKKKIEPLLSENGEVYVLNVGNSKADTEKVRVPSTPPKGIFEEKKPKAEREFFVMLGNALLIKDYPERIEKIKRKFKKFLSEKPIKIRIRAKLVEVEKSLLRELGISWRTVFSKAYIPEFWQGETAFTNVTPGQPPSGLLTFTFQRNRLNLLEFRLLAYEQEGRAKNIAETYVITVNGEPAVIASGLEYPVTKVTLSGGIAKVEPQYENIPIVLITTPIVLPDGNILLNVYLARRQINSVQEFPVTNTLTQKIPVFSTSRIDVKIPVKNGDTVVIGGAVEKSNNITESGVPGLRKVPLLGWLFKTQTKQLRDRELLIFITPEIIEED